MKGAYKRQGGGRTATRVYRVPSRARKAFQDRLPAVVCACHRGADAVWGTKPGAGAIAGLSVRSGVGLLRGTRQITRVIFKTASEVAVLYGGEYHSF